MVAQLMLSAVVLGSYSPQVRFGKTELMMPIITCGGMRQQFTWKQQATTSNSDITKECDLNFQAIVDR